jgi:hypothetical protein
MWLEIHPVASIQIHSTCIRCETYTFHYFSTPPNKDQSHSTVVPNPRIPGSQDPRGSHKKRPAFQASARRLSLRRTWSPSLWPCEVLWASFSKRLGGSGMSCGPGSYGKSPTSPATMGDPGNRKEQPVALAHWHIAGCFICANSGVTKGKSKLTSH